VDHHDYSQLKFYQLLQNCTKIQLEKGFCQWCHMAVTYLFDHLLQTTCQMLAAIKAAKWTMSFENFVN